MKKVPVGIMAGEHNARVPGWWQRRAPNDPEIERAAEPGYAAQRTTALGPPTAPDVGDALTQGRLIHPQQPKDLMLAVARQNQSTTCPAAGVIAHEGRLKLLSGVNILALRASFFFENHFLGLAGIKSKGGNGSPIGPDVSLSMIATRDIAEVAARALHERDFNGFVVRELLGERDLTMNEVTRILGDRIGKPQLQYVQTSPADFIAGLLQMGLSQSFAEDVEQAFSGLNEGHSRSREGRRPENTTPTRFETFANVMAQAYRAM